jgi:hypothetical protein
MAVRNETPSLATELRKMLLWLTLACLEENLFENRSIGLEGLVVSLKNDRNGCGFNQKVGVASKFCAHIARKRIIETPFKKS